MFLHFVRLNDSVLAPNPCAANEGKGPCSHMCLINHNRSAACACPHLMKLAPDKKTCYGKFSSHSLAIASILESMDKLMLKIKPLQCFLKVYFKGESAFWESMTYSNSWGLWCFDICCHSCFFVLLLCDAFIKFISAQQKALYWNVHHPSILSQVSWITKRCLIA